MALFLFVVLDVLPTQKCLVLERFETNSRFETVLSDLAVKGKI